jgi:hypothetical protein
MNTSLKLKRLAVIATAIALTATPAVALTAPASAMAASTPISWCNHQSPVAQACLHAGIWWNGSTSGVNWQWPECDNFAWPAFRCGSSEFGHYYLGNGETDLWQTSDVSTPVSYQGAGELLCLHVNYIVGRSGPISAGNSQWYAGGVC